MKIPLLLFTMAFCASAAVAQTAPEVSLTRLDCGTAAAPSDVTRFSDTYAYNGTKVQLTYSCYLIKHGDRFLMWDAGQPDNGGPNAPKANLVELLAQLKIKPEQINYLAVSHYHGDHIGQAALLPHSTLLIGKGDWEALTANPPSPMANPKPLAHWITGGGKFEALAGDKDIFGDGSVIMLNMPGHTPGHRSLLVKLKSMGNVLLSGDLAHFHENYHSDGIPSFNTDRADSLASLNRFKKIAEHLNATVIIQHDARDIEKLPAFPAAAK